MVFLNNIEIWQNQQVIKCIALHFFLKGNISYKYEQADSRTIFQQHMPKYVVFLTSYYCLASEVMGGGVFGLCLCLCVPYDGDSFTQMEVYHGLSSYFLPLILPDCCLGNIFCCIRLYLAFNSWSWTVGQHFKFHYKYI